jgi:hypothetical protein
LEIRNIKRGRRKRDGGRESQSVEGRDGDRERGQKEQKRQRE